MLGESVKITKDKTKLSVSTDVPMSKRCAQLLYKLCNVQQCRVNPCTVQQAFKSAWHQSLLLYLRYLKYLTKKYLKKHNVRDWLRVIASNKDRR